MNETAMGTVLGGLISLLITLIFHLVARRESRMQATAQEKLLMAEVDRLAALTNTLGRALHSAGRISARFDADGNLIGVNHQVEIHETFCVDASMDGRVERGPGAARCD